MELLAPARDIETIVTAYEAGADAVYTGLKKFSARARAKNLTIEELYKAVQISKKLNKKIYIALNTLIFENEIDELLEILLHIEFLNVDGVIIQDYGIYQIIKDFGFKIPLHASTQMGTKNHIQAKFYEKLGFKRVILERQLTIEEIRSIRKKTNIELEIFVHGAMCFSLSGYCFFSKFFTGRSGNRGECAQPCRWFYFDLEKKSKIRPFFMKDMACIDLLSEFKKIGISSLKIEGRLKGREYVYSVVSIYRKALDLVDKNLSKGDLKIFEDELKNVAFSRDVCKGFYVFSGNKKDILDEGSDSVGTFVGKVSSIFERSIFFKTKINLSVGDGLRIVNEDDSTIKIPIKAIYLNNEKVRVAKAGDFIGIPCDIAKIKKKASIYLVHRRFNYKPAIKIPSNVKVEDIKDRLNKMVSEYKNLHFKEKKDVRIYNLSFAGKEIFEINGLKIYFLTPDIYESEIDIYKKISSCENIDGVFISHPAEVDIFLKKKKIYGSFFLYVTNSFALKFMNSLGVESFSKCPDLDENGFEKIRMLSKNWFVWENIPLWVSRISFKKRKFRTASGDLLLASENMGFKITKP